MKKISIDLIVVIIASLLLITGLVMSYMAFYKIQPVFINNSHESKEFFDQELRKQGKVSYFVLPKIQTNIENDTSRLIQAEMTVALEPDLGIKSDEIKVYESQIVDLIINAVAQSTFEELDNVSGKIILAEKIKNGTNDIMKKKAVKNVLFSTFSVQLQ